MDGPAATHAEFAIARIGNLISSASVPQKCAATEKHRFRDPRKVFRLERDTILCFLSLTGQFNCTVVSVRKNAERMKIEEKRTAQTANRALSRWNLATPPRLFITSNVLG